jgi:FixJ family two-component response regulator
LSHSPPLIAIVEDESSVGKALARLLRSAGLSADTYASGEAFLQALPGRTPDCLLLDFQLPGLNGLAVQSQLKHSGLTLPVIFLTASESEDARAQALQSGARAWLRKPVSDHALLETIRLALLEKPSSPNS